MNRKTTGGLALIALALTLEGIGGARTIWALVREYKRKKLDTEESLLEYDAMRVALSRLKKDGLVTAGERGVWKITAKGRAMAEKIGMVIPQKKEVARKEKNTIIIFDIPEREAKKRWALRSELIGLGFELLQKSAWIGPGPLPKEFIEYLRQKRLLSNVHIFSINKKGTISDAI